MSRTLRSAVSQLKYSVLKEVARLAWNGELLEKITDVPYAVVPGKTATMRCCVYKERAIVAKRAKLAIGGDKSDKNVVEVIDIACDECPVGGYEVTSACRGCIARECVAVCPKGAVDVAGDQRSEIDKDKCVNCGRCAKGCPYGAIRSHERPCKKSCEANAISMAEDKSALIDGNKCVACGLCVTQCPFGAIMDKSFIVDMIGIIKNSKGNAVYKTYALIAPSITAHFKYAKPGQVVAGLEKMGFSRVMEVAKGADYVAMQEAMELSEKVDELKFMTSSCCPAFVSYIEKQAPELARHVSSNPSPMVEIAKRIKEYEPNAKTVFIGPCIAKKAEVMRGSNNKFIDCVITFEELHALFDSRDIDICSLDEIVPQDASRFGRLFAKSGGLSEAVENAVRAQKIDMELKPVVCNGLAECKKALRKLKSGVDLGNLVEGMACEGGCVGGAGGVGKMA
jgi:[FeFe] hydrogenase (group B1/B3)